MPLGRHADASPTSSPSGADMPLGCSADAFPINSAPRIDWAVDEGGAAAGGGDRPLRTEGQAGRPGPSCETLLSAHRYDLAEGDITASSSRLPEVSRRA